MKAEKLFSAIGGIDERYLDEAARYGTKKKRPVRMARILVAAAVLTVVMSISVAAASLGWMEQIRSWLGVDDSTAGYEEFAGLTVSSQRQQVQVLSEFVTGSHMVAYFSVTPVEGGPGLDLAHDWAAQFQDDTFCIENVLHQDLAVLSQSEEEVLLELSITIEGDWPESGVELALFQYDDAADSVEFMPELTLPVVDAPMLQCDGEIAVHNDAANSDGLLTQVHISTGSVELVLNHEYVEHWCDREIVPVGPETFCKRVYGEDWVSTGAPEDGTLFSMEDEQAIFQGYSMTWDAVMRDDIAPTVTLHFQDGSTLALEGAPTTDYSYLSSVEGHDAVVYRWMLYPVIDLDTVTEIEILGQTYPLTYSAD